MKADVKDEVQFRQFLKKSGKKEHVINGLVRQVLTFETYLATKGLKGLEAASEQELHAYVETLDASEIKERMRGLALYFKFSGNNSLARLASDIREQEIAKTRMAFKLREFRGVNPEEDARLEAIGIITVEDIQYLIEWVANAGFDGISPLPKKSATLSLQPANCQRFLNMAIWGGR